MTHKDQPPPRRATSPWGRSLFGLAVLVGLGLAVPTSSHSQSIVELHFLPAPISLTTFAAARAASGNIYDLFELSETESFGAEAAEHVLALSHHETVLDRPIHAPVVATLTPEHSITGLRRRYGLRQQDLEALNPGVDVNNLQPGDQVVLWAYNPDEPSRSYFRPNRGRLEHGEIMPPGNGWIVRDDTLAFAASQTIDGLVHAMRVTQAEFPGGQDLLVADISAPRGGRLRPHRSHQAGRDVDITYFRRTTDPPTFSRTRPNDLDEKRTWCFIRTLLTDHHIVYIFMARALQVRLYEYAESIGDDPAWLSEVFQFGPRGHRNSRGIIRLAPGHYNHMHIRFACGPTDIRCHD